MRWLYSAILYALTPLVLLRLLYRSRRAPDYRRRWAERFGFFPQKLANSIWVHAVSVGEVQAALPMLRALRVRHPNIPLVVTTTTPTGLQRIKTAMGTDVISAHVPYDLPGAVRRFLRRARPKVAIVMETELWPNLYHQCRVAHIPVIVANARLSERSSKGYRRIAKLVRATLQDVTLIAAQSAADQARFLSLGAPIERIQLIGNIKYDVALPADLFTKAVALRRGWSEGRAVLIAASTHAGEDEMVLAAFAELRQTFTDLLLVLVPRHPERFDVVAQLCQQRGYNVARRSEAAADLSGADVYLGDTLGDLMLLYAASDVAFVGGSLVPVGGHNVLEPAALGIPSITGPHMFNFAEVTAKLQAVGATDVIADESSLASRVAYWLQDLQQRQRASEAGKAVVKTNQGATDRLLVAIEKILKARD